MKLTIYDKETFTNYLHKVLVNDNKTKRKHNTHKIITKCAVEKIIYRVNNFQQTHKM